MALGVTRCFLFLQGPPGPFFAQLARALTAQGHRTLRVNFCGGDWFDWRGPGACAYRGNAEAWPDALRALVAREAVTDILLFGDCRPLHRIACAAGEALAIAVHVFEEGYVRPDWVTLERGGVNGHSRLPREPGAYLRGAQGLPPLAECASIPGSFIQRFREAWLYYAANWLMTPRFAQFRSHRPFPVTAEAIGWLRRLIAEPVARWRSPRATRRLQRMPYFVLPLQLDSDYQLRVHSPFSGMAEAIELVLRSFAAHAPADRALAVKLHPLDNGRHDWRRFVLRRARALGIAERVAFLQKGDIDALVHGALGVVTVNSTTGTLALAKRVPVHTLGSAVYDVPGITHQGPLEDFWRAPGSVQIEIFDAFRRVLADHCLLRGGFSSKAGRALLVPAAVTRLTQSPAAQSATPPARATA